MKSLIISLCCLLLIMQPPVFGQQVELPIDAAHSVVSFSVGFAGGISTIDGRFDNFEGVIGYKDQKDRSSLYCNVTIDVNSLNTGNSGRDADLKTAGWFDVEQFPSITFNSTKTVKTVDGYEIHGVFNMMGIEEEISIPMHYQHNQDVVYVFGEPRIAALGQYTIDRLKYKIPKRGFDQMVASLGTMALSQDVDIKLMIMGRGESLGRMIVSATEKDGISDALSLYERLEEEHKGRDSYDFGENTLGGIAERLLRKKLFEDAHVVGHYTVSRYPDSAPAHYILAAIKEQTGRTEEAIDAYKKTLRIDPEFERARSALARLQEN